MLGSYWTKAEGSEGLCGWLLLVRWVLLSYWTRKTSFHYHRAKVLFLWGVAMPAGLCGRFSLVGLAIPFSLYSQCIRPFVLPLDPYDWSDLPSEAAQNARETRKKRCPILFPF